MCIFFLCKFLRVKCQKLAKTLSNIHTDHDKSDSHNPGFVNSFCRRAHMNRMIMEIAIGCQFQSSLVRPSDEFQGPSQFIVPALGHSVQCPLRAPMHLGPNATSSTSCRVANHDNFNSNSNPHLSEESINLPRSNQKVWAKQIGLACKLV